MIRALFLTLYPPTMPSSRLRAYQYLPHLERHGIAAAVLPTLPEPWFSRLFYSPSKAGRALRVAAETLAAAARLLRARAYDVVVVQKGLLTANWKGFDGLLARANPRLVFDLDDAVYGRPLLELKPPLGRLQDPEQAAKIARAARTVVAGNDYLKKFSLQYNPRVVVIPTPVDTDRMARRSAGQKKPGDLVIGWMGLHSGLVYFDLIRTALERLARRHKFRLRIVTRPGREPFAIPGVRTERVAWSHDSEVPELEGFDIAISPMADDAWSRGKCSLKVLQYMAMEIPSVSSRAGMNLEVVEDGADGFLAGPPEEWEEKLSRLIEDPGLRERMGQRARVKVLERYSLEKTAPLLAGVLKEAAGAPAVTLDRCAVCG